MSCRHVLKVEARFFDALESGEKTFEVRRDDRAYQVGDVLTLREWVHDVGHTGRKLEKRVSYIFCGGEFGVMFGYVVLGLK